jgi:hypothetical protein
MIIGPYLSSTSASRSLPNYWPIDYRRLFSRLCI